MADRSIRVGLSRVCADPSTKGQRHPGCSGGICVCPCHGVRKPRGGLRAMVEHRRAQLETSGPGERGEAPPGPGTGDAA